MAFKEWGAYPARACVRKVVKFCESFRNADMARLHRDRFERFLDLVELRDPDRKFANSFTRRVFGHAEESNPRR